MIMFLCFVAGFIVALLMFVRPVTHVHGPDTVLYYDVTTRSYFWKTE